MKFSSQQRWAQFGIALPIMCAMVFVILGFGWGLWNRAWVVFLLIPLFYVAQAFLPSAAADAQRHLFPMLITAVYLVIGWLGMWHPGWIVMLLIPIFYIFTTPPEEQRKFLGGGHPTGG